MDLVVTGGGTGGHLFPGLAVAERLRSEEPDSRVLFCTPGRPLDRTVLQRYRYPRETIRCRGVKGYGRAAQARALAAMVPAVWRAYRVLGRFRPDVVLAVGGYVTVPVALAARARGVPLCVHEQNAVPGLANRVVMRWARRVFLSLPCQRMAAAGTELVGNPVRPEILQAARRRDRAGAGEGHTLLVLGGSQGARGLNLLVPRAVSLISPSLRSRMRLVHQCGAEDLERVRAAYARVDVSVEVAAFFQDMHARYLEADLAVSRAGATTAAELAVMGVPALFVPYPHAADDHQMANALAYVHAGGAVVARQESLTAKRMARILEDLLTDADRREWMGRAMRRLARPSAAADIVAGLRRVAAEHRQGRTV